MCIRDRSGTDLGHTGTSRPQLPALVPPPPRYKRRCPYASYAISGTEFAQCGTELAQYVVLPGTDIALCTAHCGTELAYYDILPSGTIVYQARHCGTSSVTVRYLKLGRYGILSRSNRRTR
eukprot:776379-Rhodomonas_salina.1